MNRVSDESLDEIRQAVAEAQGFETWEAFDRYLIEVEWPRIQRENRRIDRRIRRYIGRIETYIIIYARDLLAWMGYEFKYHECDESCCK